MQATDKIDLLLGDCVDRLADIDDASIDLCYLDPPFFTQRVHKLATRDGGKVFSFDDVWKDQQEYGSFLFDRLLKVERKLKPSASVFFHCDKGSTHIARLVLDQVFGPENFQSEIIWHFRRWSNSKKGLLPAHQTILWYAASKAFKFNPMLQDYSPTTNIDQIMQRRSRDARNKSVYAKNDDGSVVMGGAKKGVPLSDVWEIPFLNPKAKERVGYPTQKPLLLMSRIVELVTDPGDTVLDPFCGSGTTLVAASQLGRNAIGIDVSVEAIDLAKERIANPVFSDSALVRNGKESFRQHSSYASSYLTGVDYQPVHRNSGIDGILKEEFDGRPVFLRVQRPDETISDAASSLEKATRSKGHCFKLVVATHDDLFGQQHFGSVKVLPALSLCLKRELENVLTA